MGTIGLTNKKLPLSVSRKNVLLFSIIAMSAVLAVAVFAGGEVEIFLVSGNASNGVAGPTLNQSYAKQANVNTSFNISMNITFSNVTYHLMYINLTSLNTSGFNINGSGPYNNTTLSFTPLVIYGGTGGTTGYTSFNLSNTSNALINFSNFNNNSPISFAIGMNFSIQGIYNFTMNLSTNVTTIGQNVGNTSNFSILVDWNAPFIETFSITNNASNKSGNGTYTQGPIAIRFNLSDWSLNTSAAAASTKKTVNISIVNSSNLNQAPTNITGPTLASSSPNALGNQSWNFTFNWNGSTGLSPNVVNWNYTVRLEAYDNASNLLNISEAWFIFDNTTPNSSFIKTTTISNGSDSINITAVSSLSTINGTVTEFPGSGFNPLTSYGPSDGASGVNPTEIYAALVSNNTSYWDNASSKWVTTATWFTVGTNSTNFTAFYWYIIAPTGLGSNKSNNRYSLILNITDNATNNRSEAQNNASNLTFIFDAVAPTLTTGASNRSASYINRTGEPINFSANLSEPLLNLTLVNITIANATATGSKEVKTTNVTTCTPTAAGLNDSWLCYIDWYVSAAISQNWNYTVNVTAYDNATNLLNTSLGGTFWFIYDNITPNISYEPNIFKNNSSNIEGLVQVVSSLPWVNGTAFEFPSTRVNYGPAGSASGISNIYVAIVANNSSYWNPSSTIWQQTAYWIAVENNTSANYTSGMAVFVNWYVKTSNISFAYAGERSADSLYSVIVNVSDNTGYNNRSELSNTATNLTFKFDNVSPNVTAFSINETDARAFPNQTIGLNINVSDINLNLSSINITLYNATGIASSNASTRGQFHISQSNLTNNGTGTFHAWNLTVGVKPNQSMCAAGFCDGSGNGVEVNWTVNISVSDNASQNVTRYWSSWMFFDNRSPVVRSANFSGSNVNNTQTIDPNTAITIIFTEPIANALNTSLYQLNITNQGSPVNFTVSSNDNITVSLQPISQNYSVNYTLLVQGASNNDNGVKDLTGNLLNFTYNTTYKTIAQASGTGSGGATGGGGGAASGATVQNVVSEDTPSATVSFNVGEAATFSIPSSPDAAGGGGVSESHSLKVDSIVGGLVTVTISSAPIKLQLSVNVPSYVDVNGDGSNDIIVTVLEILSNTAAKIKIDYIAKPIKKAASVAAPSPKVTAPATPAVPEATTPEEAVVPAEEAQPLPQSTLLIVVVVIIALVAVGYWYTQKKGQATF